MRERFGKQFGKPITAAVILMAASLYGVTLAAPPIKGDPAKGRTLAQEACAACHGEDGNSASAGFPKLAAQHAEYLLREMKDYREGRRKSDVMAPMLASLSEDDLANVAAYYAKQDAADGTVSKPALLTLGKNIYLEGNTKSGVPSCEGCHEENGEGSKRFPRVAGQHVEYTLEQLRQYASGERSNGVKVMRTIAERLTPEEAQAVAEYMASLK